MPIDGPSRAAYDCFMATHKSLKPAGDDVNVTIRLPKAVDRAVELAVIDGVGPTKQAIIKMAICEWLELEI